MDGKTWRIGSERALVLDVVRLASKVPSFPVERWFELAELSAARAASKTRISWISLFARAYGLAGRDVPQLRQSYIGWPVPRVYQSPYSIISVSVNRQTDKGERLLFGRLRFPEQRSLVEIQNELDGYIYGDLNQVFKQQMFTSTVPSWIRRFGWWWRLQWAVKHRARRVGTGSISVLASFGVNNRLHPCILTSSLAYGPQEPDGRMWVTLQCDHRVIDGAAAARAINAMHDYLRGQVLQELLNLPSPADAK
jgi:hypothetical protein